MQAFGYHLLPNSLHSYNNNNGEGHSTSFRETCVIGETLTLLKKNFMAPIYGWGSTAPRLEPFRGGSLLFTTTFPEIPGAQNGQTQLNNSSETAVYLTILWDWRLKG